MVALARQKAAIGDLDGAARLCLSAVESPRCPPEARVIAGELLGRDVPSWHFLIVRDQVRNLAYRQALQRAVRPGSVVLEIGAGTGLLAMMAAEAGAARVITCEAQPAIALAAQRVIARNGFADRVQIIAKHSSAIDPVADLGGPADVLVSEIVSNDLLGEGVLATMEDAVGRLVRPGGSVIPARGRIVAALAEDLREARARSPSDSGFDLSDFDVLAKTARDFQSDTTRLALRSEPVVLFEFDFASGGPYRPQHTSLQLESSGGDVGGTVQWIDMDLDDAVRLQNPPGTRPPSCWGVVFRPFFRTLHTRAGEAIEVQARHERDALRIWS
jgi:type II protein arginine methyltransferase